MWRAIARITTSRLSQHPELIERHDGLLCSINDRMGALVRAMAPLEDAGRDYDPLTGDYIDDLFALALDEKNEQEEQDLYRQMNNLQRLGLVQ